MIVVFRFLGIVFMGCLKYDWRFNFRKVVFLLNVELWMAKQDLIHYTLNGIMVGQDYLLKLIH